MCSILGRRNLLMLHQAYQCAACTYLCGPDCIWPQVAEQLDAWVNHGAWQKDQVQSEVGQYRIGILGSDIVYRMTVVGVGEE